MIYEKPQVKTAAGRRRRTGICSENGGEGNV